ncbi:MAG: InlB B-repeat-containing protein [Gallintestinimicrobium sp.]
MPDAPERQYYTFGWYKNKARTVAFDVQNMITGYTTLYAG